MLVPISVQPICIILLLWHKHSAPLHHRLNWCQPPFTAAPQYPMVALPFRRLIILVPPSQLRPDFCAAIVQFYRTYSLYYLVLCVSSNLCAAYLYYFADMTQILIALAASTQLVPATASRRPSISNGGAPVPAPANVGTSILPLSHPRPIQYICPIQIVANQFPHTSQSIKSSFSK